MYPERWTRSSGRFGDNGASEVTMETTERKTQATSVQMRAGGPERGRAQRGCGGEHSQQQGSTGREKGPQEPLEQPQTGRERKAGDNGRGYRGRRKMWRAGAAARECSRGRSRQPGAGWPGRVGQTRWGQGNSSCERRGQGGRGKHRAWDRQARQVLGKVEAGRVGLQAPRGEGERVPQGLPDRPALTLRKRRMG